MDAELKRREETKQAADAAAARAEEARAKAEADAAVVLEKTRAELLAEIQALQDERTRLRREVEDRDHRLGLKQTLIEDLTAVGQIRGIHAEPLAEIVEGIAARKQTLDKTTAERRAESGRMMNALALQQGLPAPHPELLEENDG